MDPNCPCLCRYPGHWLLDRHSGCFLVVFLPSLLSLSCGCTCTYLIGLIGLIGLIHLNVSLRSKVNKLAWFVESGSAGFRGRRTVVWACIYRNYPVSLT
jgi:hypothetical protein